MFKNCGMATTSFLLSLTIACGENGSSKLQETETQEDNKIQQLEMDILAKDTAKNLFKMSIVLLIIQDKLTEIDRRSQLYEAESSEKIDDQALISLRSISTAVGVGFTAVGHCAL